MATQNAIDTSNPIEVSMGGTGNATLTIHSLLVGATTGAITQLAVGATNQVLLGNTDADPSWGAVDITTDVTGTLPVGSGGTGNTTFTDGGILVGATTASFEALAVGGTGTILTGVAGANPTWTTATYPATVAEGDILVASAANVITVIGGGTATHVLTANGAGAAPTYQAVPAASYCSDAEAIAGTEAAKAVAPLTLKAKLGDQTAHGVLVGAGTDTAITALAVGTDGQVLVGSSAADPVFATLSSTGTIAFTPGAGTLALDCRASTDALTGVVELATDAEAIAGTASTVINCTSLKAKLGTQTSHGLPYGAATTGAIAWTAEPTHGQILIGETGAIPQLGTLTAGTGITVTNAAHAITVASTGTTLVNETGTTYEFLATDIGKLVTFTNAAAITVTVPVNADVAIAIGSQILCYQGGAGQVTFTPEGGVTIRSADSLLSLYGQYSVCALVKILTDTWVLAGDLA